jgi:hypothetical protein
LKGHVRVSEHKIFLTAESSHPKLLELIEASKLPKEYGGEATAEATCIYSERGPWTEVENHINYQEAVSGDKKAPKEEESKGEFELQGEEPPVDLLNGMEGDEFNYAPSDEEDGNLDEFKNVFN